MVADTSRWRNVKGSNLVPATTTTTSLNNVSWTVPSVNQWSVGFDRHFRLLEDLHTTARSTYPPYNIIRINSEEYVVELAVAGFTKSEIEITQHDGTLTVTGKKSFDNDDDFVHKGIATRNFTHKFALADYVEVIEAVLENGILRIELKQDLPEEKRPKTIEIS